MANESRSCARLLDVFVHAPVGLALYARDTAPGFLRLFVSRGREALQHEQHRVDERVHLARSIGEHAVAYGPPEVRRRLLGGVGRAREVAVGVIGARSPGRRPGEDSRPEDVHEESRVGISSEATGERPAPSEPETGGSAPSPGFGAYPRATRPPVSSFPAPPEAPLPIPDYDELSASQVVERLEGLAPEELDAVAAYERARRGRRTILGKIEQLTA